jgi:hypothetical protein
MPSGQAREAASIGAAIGSPDRNDNDSVPPHTGRNAT